MFPKTIFPVPNKLNRTNSEEHLDKKKDFHFLISLELSHIHFEDKRFSNFDAKKVLMWKYKFRYPAILLLHWFRIISNLQQILI
jgi:hypothetical protein